MRSPYLPLSASLLLSASLFAQTPGVTPTPPQVPGTDTSTVVVGPQALTGTVPAAYRTVFGNTNNNIPISWSPERYQQVFLGSELPKALVIKGLGFRHDQAFANFKGQTVELEITLAYTKKTPANLTTTFASNFDVSTPAPVIVLPRSKFKLPDFAATKPTNPQVWQIQIPFKVPFVWTQVTGRNMLVQIRIYGNSNNNAIFTYPLDAASGTSATTTRLYGTGPTATTGSIGRNYGLVMNFLDKILTTGSYVTFGKGCPGTGGAPGVVLPSAYVSKMGNSNNIYGVAWANQRYQQIYAGTQVGGVRVFTGHALRMRNATYTGPSQTLEIKLSSTSKTPATLTTTFSSNITSAQTTVFTKKTYKYPNMVPNTNPAKFDIAFKWDKPFIWTAKKGQSLLIEVLNSSTTRGTYFVDAASGDTNVARLWGTGTTATTGSKGSNFGLITKFTYTGSGSLVPVLSNTGTPILAKSFTVDLSSARASTAAALIFGGSNTKWGSANLPLDLSPLGAKGCSLLVSPDILSAGLPVGLGGTASAKITIPNSKVLIGVQWHNQFFVLDAKANGLGLAFSNGGTGKVGEQ